MRDRFMLLCQEAKMLVHRLREAQGQYAYLSEGWHTYRVTINRAERRYQRRLGKLAHLSD